MSVRICNVNYDWDYLYALPVSNAINYPSKFM